MKRITHYVLVVLLLSVLAGCGTAAMMVQAKSQSERTGVFQELPAAETIPDGFADLTIKANIKTHSEGHFAAESKDSAHGKEFYSFLVNIDGQAVLWKVKGEEHRLPRYLEGKTSRDPEAGDGMRYVLDKRIRLAAGRHAVFFSLPEEQYHTTVDITVQSGKSYVLEFKPAYKYKILPTRIPSFLQGVSAYDASFGER